ncbi:DUF2306 domain-containing protein [Paenibacillus hodogayensis]|uniref:DUF2306 domain-containing protein n=1 Tax=Paenibacillus hodogayensis TaxID=279208 RepID=A0ABV5W335_9BACL
MRTRNTVIVVLALMACMWIMHTVTKNFVTDPDFLKFLSHKDRPVPDPELFRTMLRVHIGLAVVSLVTGPIGTIRRIRVQRPALHRWSGRLYVLSILLNVVPGFYVSFFATGGWLSVLGFLMLNSLWLGTTVLGYVHIRRKQVAKHTGWMTRSFFLTFANLTIHVVLAVAHSGLKLPYDTAYTAAVWSSFVLNLALAELVIRKKWMK